MEINSNKKYKTIVYNSNFNDCLFLQFIIKVQMIIIIKII